jgi:hypothetical protein
VTSRRNVITALLLGAVVTLIGCSFTWATATLTVLSGTGSRTVTVSGGEAVPQAMSLTIVAIAGALALLSLRSWARQVVGILLVAVGIVIEFGIVDFLRNPVVEAGNDTVGLITTNLWWVVAAVGALLILLSGAVTAVFSRSWGALGVKYEAEGTRKTQVMSPWDALNSGQDPTIAPADPKSDIEPA